MNNNRNDNLDFIRLRVDAARARRGQWMAFTLVILGFTLIAFAIARGATAIGCAVAGTLLVAVITGFLATGRARCQCRCAGKTDTKGL